jgi:DNA-binding MarR family transcriptional regulator
MTTPEADILANCLLGRLRMLSRAVTRMFEHAMADCSLKAGQLTLLAMVAHYQPITASQLAQRSVLEKSTLSRDLAVLVKHGLIYQGHGSRQKPLTLSDKGRQLLDRVWPVWQQTHQHLLTLVGSDGEQAIHQLLERIQAR